MNEFIINHEEVLQVLVCTGYTVLYKVLFLVPTTQVLVNNQSFNRRYYYFYSDLGRTHSLNQSALLALWAGQNMLYNSK